MDFTKTVQSYRKRKCSAAIYNSSWEHAAILYQELLGAALEEKKDVKIVTGHLNPDFYSDLINTAQELLQKQKIEVIVLNTDFNYEGNDFAALIDTSVNGSLIINHDKLLTKAPHFILVGDDIYRFETDHNNTKAIASFNNKPFGKFLFEIFNNLKTDIIKREEQSPVYA